MGDNYEGKKARTTVSNNEKLIEETTMIDEPIMGSRDMPNDKQGLPGDNTINENKCVNDLFGLWNLVKHHARRNPNQFMLRGNKLGKNMVAGSRFYSLLDYDEKHGRNDSNIENEIQSIMLKEKDNSGPTIALTSHVESVNTTELDIGPTKK